MFRYNPRVTRLIDRVVEERFDPPALNELASYYLIDGREPNAEMLAEALSTAMPMWDADLAVRLERFGERWAYSVVRLSMPGLSPRDDRTIALRRAERLATRLEIIFMQTNRHGHLLTVRTFRDHVGRFVLVVHALRDLSSKRGVCSSLGGVLVERLTLEAGADVDLFGRLASRVLRTGTRARAVELWQRAARIVPEALDHPFEPMLDAEALMRRQDVLLDVTIPGARAEDLPTLIAGLKLPGRVQEVTNTTPASFLGALGKNPHFRNAAEGLSDLLADVSRN